MGNCHGCAASAADPSDAAVQAEQGGVPKKQPQSAATSATAGWGDLGSLRRRYLGWGDAEAAVLVRAIAYAVRHCEFEEGAAPVELDLRANKFGEEAKAAIRGACGGKIELLAI